ncbi:hypothetical protein AMECASPLE_025347 [Ameca splendens]|uniref:Uncharacterized protein n=1 Tax=Ameca splendens TaxID=208324 RepID=A0ABV0Y4H4_9TELE
MDTQEDNMDFDEWTSVSRGRERGRGKAEEGKMFDSQRSKRELEENSPEEERVVRRKIGREECKIILKLKNEEEKENLSPILLSREIKKKIGDVEMVKVLRDGNILVSCKTKEERLYKLKTFARKR